jgi:mannosyltransferase OCH1-like enzyme
MNDANRIIQGLWVGNKLSAMEQLSIASFLTHGHDYHLYAYEQLEGVPKGTTVLDGNEILPASRIFQYASRPSYAGFANYFRYKLLLERGGWWADTDTVCVRPFDFESEYVFSSETGRAGEVINAGVIKAPPRSDFAAYAWSVCDSKNPQSLVWGETGPRLTGEAVRAHSLERYVQRADVFCPITFVDWELMTDPERTWVFPPITRAVHLWNELWRKAGKDKDAQYDPGCLYEAMKSRYLRSNSEEFLLRNSTRTPAASMNSSASCEV